MLELIIEAAEGFINGFSGDRGDGTCLLYTSFKPLQIFILPGGHSRPCAGDLIGEDGVLHALLHAAGIPFIIKYHNLHTLAPE